MHRSRQAGDRTAASQPDERIFLRGGCRRPAILARSAGEKASSGSLGRGGEASAASPQEGRGATAPEVAGGGEGMAAGARALDAATGQGEGRPSGTWPRALCHSRCPGRRRRSATLRHPSADLLNRRDLA